MLVICTTMIYNVLNTFGYRCIPHVGKDGGACIYRAV